MLQFIKGDIQSGDLLSYILETEQIDTVMHFAAQVKLFVYVIQHWTVITIIPNKAGSCRRMLTTHLATVWRSP